MVTKAEICKWVGLSGIQLDHIIRELEKQNIDWQEVIDWEQHIAEARDFGGRTEAVWDKLSEYGISKPILESQIGQELKKAELEEIESHLGSKEGVKSLLRRIYDDPKTTRKQKEQIRQAIIEGSPEITTLLALYNGKEQDYAKKFLKEMVFSPTASIRDLLQGDTLRIKSSRGWITEINGIPLKKKIRSIDFVEKIQDYDLVASQPSKEYTIAIYRHKKAEKPVLRPVAEVKANELATAYSYGELQKLGKEHNLRLSGSKIKMLSELIRANIL